MVIKLLLVEIIHYLFKGLRETFNRIFMESKDNNNFR